MNGMHGIIFSYEKENGLRELIENRVHGSIPFGGDYRIIDFILSSMVNAGITDVGVIMHGKCQSLLDHLGSGKSWDLSRNYGGPPSPITSSGTATVSFAAESRLCTA